MEPYRAVEIANSFLKLAKAKNKKLDPMKLQKLIYYAHGWSLAILDKPLIDEEIQAWRFGPVIRSVYHAFKQYGATSIESRYQESDDAGIHTPMVSEHDLATWALLKRIWEIYGEFDAIQLSNMSHAEGTPWHDTWDRNTQQLRSISISNDSIKQHFKSKKHKTPTND